MIIDAQRRRRLGERLEAVQQRIVPPWTAKGVLPDDETQWGSILESPARARGDAWIVGRDYTSSGFRAGDAVVFDGQGWVNNGAAYIWERDLALPSERFRDVPSSELVLSPNGGDCLTVDAFGGIVVSRLVGGDMTTVDPSGNSITNTGGSTGGTAQFPVLDPPFASSPALPALATRNGFGFVDFVREDGTWVWMAVGGFNRIRKLYGSTADLRNRLAGDILSDCIVSTDKGLHWTQQNASVFSEDPPPTPPDQAFEGVAHPLLVHYRDTAVQGSPDVVYMIGGICSYAGKPLTRIGANHVYRTIGPDIGVSWERRRVNNFDLTIVRSFGAAGLVGVSGSLSDGLIWVLGGAITRGEGDPPPTEPTAADFIVTTTTTGGTVLGRSLRSSTTGALFSNSVGDMASSITWSSPFLNPTSFVSSSFSFGYTRLPTLVAPNQFLIVAGLMNSDDGQGDPRSMVVLVNPDNVTPDPYTYLTISNQFDGIVQRYPTSRVQPQLAYDMSFDTVILVGGNRVSGANFNGTIFLADPALLIPDRLAWREQFGLTNEQGMSLAFGLVREGALACRGDGKVYLIAGSISTLEKHQREVTHDSFEVEDLQNDRILEFTLRPAKRMVTLGPNVATTDLDNNGLRATIILQPPRPLTLPRLLGRSKYTEYVPGDGPVILCSLLGGHVLDRQITPLSGGEGMAAAATTMTNEEVLDLGTRMQLDLGYKPHMIFVHLAPEFVDASTFIWRRSESAPFSSLAAAHTAASRVWFEAHEWMCMAREKVVDQHGRGLLLEVVGTASSSQVEIGYLVPRSQLETPPLTADHSARRLQELKSATTESFIRGEASLGKAVQDRLAAYTSSSSSTAQALMRHLQVTPSPSHPVPASTTYTPGSDLTAVYGSSLGATPETWVKDDTIDAVRLAIPQASVLNAELSRSALNSVLVSALDEWLRV
jgi:hypothetical protein